MRRPSAFDFDISASADKKRRARARTGGGPESGRRCDKPGCDKPGKFRAPRSPDHLDSFYWFCLDHVREYNLKWNFFQDQSDADLERQFASDKVWERPTRPFSETVQGGRSPHAEGRAWARFGFDDPMELLGEKATLNPGGVRIGTAEIHRQVEQLDEVEESLVIGQDWPPGEVGDVRVVLFVKLREGLALTPALIDRIQKHIRANTTPRHVPAKVVQVTDIPRTKSNKIVELAVRNVVHGRPVKNLDALANPEALEQYRDRPELRS